MSSLGGDAPYHPRFFFQAVAASWRASVYMGAAGAVEAACRLAADPSLYDSRIDALVYAGAAVVVAWAFGLIVGFLAALVLITRWGEVAASLWPATFALTVWPLALLLEPLLGRRPGAWLAVPLAVGASVAVVAGASSFTPADGLILRPRERRRRRRYLIPILIPVLVLLWLGGRLVLDRRRPPDGARSLLLITVDTLRADALGSFRDGRPIPAGLERARTERLDALAGQSWTFTEASTPIPKTPQAIASLMTGNYPGRHGLRDLFSGLDRSSLTIAEILRSRGWRTRAVVTNMLIGRGSGLEQGFDRYYDKDGLRPQIKRLAVADLAARIWPPAVTWTMNRFPSLRMGSETARETTDRAIRVLREGRGRPYFLWVHYLDPHWTYWPPEPYRSEADTAPGTPLTLYDDIKEGRLKIGEVIHRNRMSEEEVRRVNALYAGEVTYNDQEIGRLVDEALNGRGGGKTLVIFTSDHGESLGEHGYFFSHGDLVNEPSMRIPLIVRPPRGVAGVQVRAPVSLVDLMPTALEMLGPVVPSGIDGQSILPLIGSEAASGETSATRPLFGESDLSYLKENPHPSIPGEAGKIRFIRSGPYKLVRKPRDHDNARRFDPDLGSGNEGRVTIFGFGEATELKASAPDEVLLYNLDEDPAETTDVSETDPRLTAAMTAALDRWLLQALEGSASARDASEELLDALRSLGYVDASGGGP